MTTAAPDRAPDWVAEGTPEPLRTDLARLVGESSVLGRATDLDPLRLGREPLSPDPSGRRPAARPGGRGPRDRLRPRARHPGHVPGGRHEPERPRAGRRHPGRRPSPLARRRDPGRRRSSREGPARHGARPREPRSEPPSPKAGTRPRLDRHRDSWRSRREQLGRDAVRDALRLVPDRHRHDLHDRQRDLDRHVQARRRRALRVRGARARRRYRRAPRRDPRRQEACEADPPQVRDQEHDGLPPVRVPRRRRARRDLPPPHRRL